MLIQEKKGNISSIEVNNRVIDWLPVEWYETGKRMLRKHTVSGKEMVLKFLKENPQLAQGDVLYEDARQVIAVDILPCDALVIQPRTLYETASVCYEIGNKHLPLFFEHDEVLTPFEMPLYRVLQAAGYIVRQEKRKLLRPLRTTVAPHLHSNGTSLFSKIMQLTNPGE